VEAAGLKGAVEIVEPTRAERTIARRAAEIRATVPDLELSATVDAGACAALAEGSVTAAVVRASALALREHPRANGAYRDGRFELYSRINVGVVVAVAGELVTATVFDADQKQLPELGEEIASLESRAAELLSPERAGATFTVWPVRGVTTAGPLIEASHAAALSVGEMRDAAVVRDGGIAASRVMSLTLACDHRILYGEHATGFLARIRELLEREQL
jgi:pyruvate dehydrogenase E2 component (dihydrolipoamide acetyltransferase)